MLYNDVRKYVYDKILLVNEIKKYPHTYKTLLTEECRFDNTLQFILRKKLNQLHSDGEVHKTTIPGTRFGEVIFYTNDKKYNVVIEDSRVDIKVYCIFKYKDVSKFYILVNEYYLLDGCEWRRFSKEKTFFRGNILKWI